MTAIIQERFVLSGDVGAPGFPRWIQRHAGRLGVAARIVACNAHRMELTVDGPPDLVDALELGCSLGPIEVWVEAVERESLPPQVVCVVSNMPEIQSSVP